MAAAAPIDDGTRTFGPAGARAGAGAGARVGAEVGDGMAVGVGMGIGVGVVAPDTAAIDARPALVDRRFSALLPAADWRRLPPAVRRRFERHLAPRESALYVGEVEYTRLSAFGWLYACCARLAGSPLPLSSGGRVAAAVVVTEDEAAGGQSWTRLYARPGRAPHAIHSGKRFAGPTGLEECVGAGVGMRLALAVEHRALVFRSRGFFLRALGCEWTLPAWLCPGTVEVVHREERAGRFSFTLRVDHPRFGRIVEQVAWFADAGPGGTS